ncbi:hypothetical protein [Rheinheimera sp. F8]|uniref:hypothetical protein n=1 Tax=Rheinheimera sp. F8 TaxID=1763998 RepID=UPI0007449D03|nr:hypothetical protein [Rheinheimera sp. F8]ALZ74365.1 hypothetical protein ATY27_00320 [Rheinheimera sp. F8]
MVKFISLSLVATLFAGGYSVTATAADHALLHALQPYCGKAFAGTLISKAPEDAAMAGQALIVHIADCRTGEVRMPFHVGEDRSRTWVLRVLPQGLQLKHDHRHQDGSHDELTMYGGTSADSVSALTQNFPADAYSKLMFQSRGRTAALQNVWSFTLEPGQTLTYRLSRPGREFAVAFDLTQPVALPPPAWGAVDRRP